MVSQCANPKCRAQFLYLTSGNLFAVFHDGAHSSHVEFFWLCAECDSDPHSLSFLPDGARVVPKFFALRAREAENDVKPASDSSVPSRRNASQNSHVT
jgi:hypothetical protein